MHVEQQGLKFLVATLEVFSIYGINAADGVQLQSGKYVKHMGLCKDMGVLARFDERVSYFTEEAFADYVQYVDGMLNE